MMDSNSSLQKGKHMLNLGRHIKTSKQTSAFLTKKVNPALKNFNSALNVHVDHYFLILNTINTHSVLFST